MNIGIIDTDLLDNGTRHPNLALMKISGYFKDKGHVVKLLFDYRELAKYDKVYLSKVFTYTKVLVDLSSYNNIEYGGTGFFLDKAPDLPKHIEHHFPDYHLYDEFVGKEIARGIKVNHFFDYMDYSIGFTTRGCFRKCEFCVNRKYDGVFPHSKVSEFLDPSRKNIYLWDDNFFGYNKWNEVVDELEDTGRYFQFRQGLDIRLLTKDKAIRFSKVKYKGDYIFAFDYLKDKEIIKKKLELWRKYTSKTTKMYILCAHESQDENDIISIFERIKILMKYKCLPYIMRFNGWDKGEMRGMYINISRWANQPDFYKKKTFREFCEANQNPKSKKKCASIKYMEEFEKKYPEIGKKYFDMRFEDLKKY